MQNCWLAEECCVCGVPPEKCPRITGEYWGKGEGIDEDNLRSD